MTPYEAVYRSEPTYAHMNPYGCRAYTVEHKIPRKSKMDPRAHIGYLVGYDSRNIYRIWIPSKKRVIRTRDVTFDHDAYWTPDDLDIGDILRDSADTIINTLDIPLDQTQQITEVDDILNAIGFDYNVVRSCETVKIKQEEDSGVISDEASYKDHKHARDNLKSSTNSPSSPTIKTFSSITSDYKDEEKSKIFCNDPADLSEKVKLLPTVTIGLA